LQTSCNILLQTYSFLPHCTSMCVPQCLHFIGSNWQISFGWRTIKRRNGICNWRQISYIWVCPMLNGILYICTTAVLLTYIIWWILKKCIRLRNRPDRWMCCQVCGCIWYILAHLRLFTCHNGSSSAISISCCTSIPIHILKKLAMAFCRLLAIVWRNKEGLEMHTPVHWLKKREKSMPEMCKWMVWEIITYTNVFFFFF